MSIHTRAVELLAVVEHGDETAVVVHELLGEKNLSGTDDAWMYEVGGVGVVGETNALQLCIDGFYTDAIVALADSGCGELTRLGANLRDRATAARQQSPLQFSTRVCSCDDW
jgi:hypothetical protein